jgi:hypothetical protein
MNKLITRSLELGEIGALQKMPVELLNEIESRQVNWVREYTLKHGVTPTLSRFQTEFPLFIELPTTDPIDDVFDQELILKKNLHFKAIVAKHQAALIAGEDPTEIVEEMARIFMKGNANVVSTADYDRSGYLDAVTTYSYGVEFLDSLTGGLARGDLVWIVGRPGSNKTTFAEWLMVGWSLCGLRCLYISNENSGYEAMKKIDAFFGGWNPMNARTGNWTEQEACKIVGVAKMLSELGGEIIIPIEPALNTGDVAGLIETHKPDIVLIDGVYLMSESGKAVVGWEDVAAVSRSIKRLARKTHIPFLGVIQANREAEGGKVTRGTIAYSDAFLQDADTIIGLNKQKDSKVIGEIVKSRWGPMLLSHSFLATVDFGNMYVGFENVGNVEVSEEDW